jgi:hypothetical protein
MSGYGRDEYGSGNGDNDGGYGNDQYGSRQQQQGGNRRNDDDDSYGGRPQQGGGYDGADNYNGRQEGGYSSGRQGERYGEGAGQQGGYGRQEGSFGGNKDNYNQQSDYGRQEGSYSEGGRQNHGQSTGTSYSGGGGGYNNDFSGAEHAAQSHAGNSGDSSMFSSALGMLAGKQQHLQNEPLNEQHAVQSHQNFYGGGGGGGNQQQADAGSMGSAAAMQALKMFSGGQGGQGGQGQHQGGGQNQFIGMAMAEASKLFGTWALLSDDDFWLVLTLFTDQQSAQGNTGGASKQDAVGSAAQMALKMFMKSEMGGGGGGGAGGLMSMASKFL